MARKRRNPLSTSTKVLLVTAGVVAAGGAIALARARDKKRCTLGELILGYHDRGAPEEAGPYGNKPHLDWWRPMNEDPVVIGEDNVDGGYAGPIGFGLPSRYNRPGIKLYGVTTDAISAKLTRRTKLLDREIRANVTEPGYFVTLVPRQLGTTTFAVGDANGPLEHVAVAFSDLKGSFGKETQCV